MPHILQRCLLALLFTTAVSGCSINYKVAGSFENANEVFRGDIAHNLLIGQAEVVAIGENSGIVCKGRSYVTYYPPFAIGCAGQRGKVDMTCDDGRTLDVDFRANSCASGDGRGSDAYGNRFTFAFGLDEKEAEKYITQRLPQIQHRPALRGFAPTGANTTPKASKTTPATFDRQTAAKGLSDFPMKPQNLTFKTVDPRPDDIAVIIANADYSAKGTKVPDVVPAYADAEGFKKYATTALGVPTGNVVMVRDATSAELAYIFGTKRNPDGKLAEWIKPNKSHVYIYYAGHGAPGDKSGRGFLVPVDVDGSMIGVKGLALETLYANLSKLPARSVTLVAEVSFSGISESGNVLNKMLPGLKPKSTPVPGNLTVAIAGAPSQVASWERDASHGLFTKYLLKGMAGEADQSPYGNENGQSDWHEVGSYLEATLSKLTRKYYGRRQVAQITVSKTP
jgi:hypothetical protein